MPQGGASTNPTCRQAGSPPGHVLGMQM